MVLLGRVLLRIQPEQEPRALLEPTVAGHDAASMIFNLPDYRVAGTVLLPGGVRHGTVESMFPPGCPSCGVIASRVKERRCQRLRDIPVAGAVVLLWDKRRWFCDEYLCERKSFCESTPQVPRRARSTRGLRETVLDAVITSGRAVSETAMAFGISWWLVQQAIGDAALRLPDVDLLAPRMLGIDEHRYRRRRSLPWQISWNVPRCRKPTGSTGPCATGGQRSKSSSSPGPPQPR